MYKGWGCLLEVLKRTPKSYQDSVLCVWLENSSPLKSGTIIYLIALFWDLRTSQLRCQFEHHVLF